MPLCSAHSCGTPPCSAPCAARGGKSRDEKSSRNRLRIRIRYPQVSCLPEGKYLFFTIPRPIFTSCGPVGARAVNVFVKPSAEPNAVRAMPRREMEHENERFRQAEGQSRTYSGYAEAGKRLLKTNEPLKSHNHGKESSCSGRRSGQRSGTVPLSGSIFSRTGFHSARSRWPRRRR